SVFLHGMDFTYALRSQRKKWLAKKILNNAKYIICGNSYTAELVKQFVGNKQEDKVGVVNPGIALTPLSAQAGSPSPAPSSPRLRSGQARERGAVLKNKYNLQNKVVLFSLGRLVKRKGFDKVIETIPEVLKKAPNLVYVIAGAGPDEEYLKTSPPAPLLIRRGETGERLIFLGKISDKEKWAWLNLCDIFVMPARNMDGDFEGFGIVYLEANLCNKPVIAGDSGGVRDAVKDHVNGILVDPDNTEAIAEGILELALNQILRQKLGEQGWRRAIEKFNWEKQARKIFQLINRSYKSY
ncbi:glycosyltransferase family 4 protein, partial [Candidatus Parcubacteria bacterium]|nr:glycosyltransferase family 4 protein [Candidatus Parcubacteria bacterium]